MHPTPPVASNPAPAADPKPAEATQSAKADSQKQDPSLRAIVSLEGEAAYDRLLKSTCWIYAESFDKKEGGMGSGALIDRENKLILTAYHVVDLADNGKGRIMISFPIYERGKVIAEKTAYQRLVDRKEALTAWIEYVDKKKDLAILKVPEITEGVFPLPLAGESPKPGQRVHSMGNPGASDGMWVYSPGQVRQVFHDNWVIGSGKEGEEPTRYSSRVIEAASPVNPGDSGGPMITENKELVGVAHAIKPGAQLMSKFIDIEAVREFLDSYFKSKNLKGTILDAAPAAPKNREVGDVVKKLEDADANTRSQAAAFLGRMGRDAQPAVKALLKALKDKDEYVRLHSAEALELIGGLSHIHLPTLIDALKDTSSDVRLAVVRVITVMGPNAESASNALVEVIKTEKDPQIRRKAAHGLAAIGADAKTVLPLLQAGLKDESAEIRVASAEALAKLGAGAAPAIKELGEALEDNQQSVRLNALKAIAAIGPDAKSVLPKVHKCLRGRDKDTRLEAILVVASFRAEDTETIKCLVDLLEEKDYREKVNDALVRIGRGAVPTLNRELNNGKVQIRLGVIEALKQLGADARQALPTIVQLGRVDPDAEVRKAATTAAIEIQRKITGR
jgi:HEAT repeat protein